MVEHKAGIGPASQSNLPTGRGWPGLAEAGRGWRLEAALSWIWRWQGVLEGELADASGRLAIFHMAACSALRLAVRVSRHFA